MQRPVLTALLLIFGVLVLTAGRVGADEKCDNGALVADRHYCPFIRTYLKPPPPPDPRLVKYLGADAAYARSIAFIVGIGSYPNLDDEHMKLPAALTDADNLEIFFRDSQHFDEVIKLTDENATFDNIRYFLKQYLRQEARRTRTMGRLVLAFSTHGVRSGEADDETGSLALSQASTAVDDVNQLDLGELRAYIERLEGLNFHVLLLMNSCYGGGIFRLANNGSPNNPMQRGGRGITPDGPQDLAYADEAGQMTLPYHTGSVFFDAVIRSINEGTAENYDSTTDPNGSDSKQQGIVRYGALQLAIDDALGTFQATHPEVPQGATWSGSLEPPTKDTPGGFFFLVPPPRAATHAETRSMPALAAPKLIDAAQSVPDARQRKAITYGSPIDYTIRGVDVSHYSGDIDWQRLADSLKIQFAYIKSSEGANRPDAMFRANWKGARAVGLAVGAYHIVTFCGIARDDQVAAAAGKQLALIRKQIPPDSGSGNLPIALDLEYANGAIHGGCFSDVTRSEASHLVDALAEGIAASFGRSPIVFVTGAAGSLLSDLNDYPIWTAKRKDVETPIPRQWTFWQYSSPLRGQFDLNVFNGSQEEFRSLLSQ